MRVGIVGLPNAGKSSLFNALTGASAEAANYPFTTIEPNVAVVPVPDARLDALARTLRAERVVYDTIEFRDIAGLIGGAHKGEGLGNRFLAHIRETDAILHVVRTHRDARVVHPEGVVDPLSDIQTVETELLLADLEQAERRLDRVTRTARGGDRAAVAEERWLRQLVDALADGRPARTLPAPPDAADAGRSLALLTAKPMLFVANVEEGVGELPLDVAEHAHAQGAGGVAVCARLEAELSELDGDEATVLREELHAGEPSLAQIIRGAFSLLDLIAFFTVDTARPAQSWHVRRGSSAVVAAAAIHSDIARGFVRAEVVAWDELVDAGSYATARERATLRVEGRDYPVADGDVLHVRFTP